MARQPPARLGTFRPFFHPFHLRSSTFILYFGIELSLIRVRNKKEFQFDLEGAAPTLRRSTTRELRNKLSKSLEDPRTVYFSRFPAVQRFSDASK
ncbi:hypothetical protein EVAR_55460_1 [Eumeta japonica]|uniref:Uncharacterized protein n=1 Tax=Eumeta variegata TaxID=151549 RepID=A0A4C1Y3P2_EUMVA|nr:hypothetical protein EVAR_55460_1 [Eumeta japonica]